MTTWRKMVTLFAAALLVAGFAACGDDDDDETAVADDESSETTTAEDEGHEMPGDEGAPEANPCAEGMSPEDAGLPPAEEPADGATAVTVTAKEYEFAGTDELATAGSYAITFENEGVELHEMVIQHIDESETRSLEELLAADGPPETATDVAFGFACPGSSTVFNADMSEPGRYVVLCFIPTGTTAETDPADFESGGAPHAMNGMAVELDVA